MRPSSRTAFAAVVLSATLALGAAACSKSEGTDQPSPASPASSVSPESSVKASDANTVPPGVSGQGSGGGQGQGQSAP